LLLSDQDIVKEIERGRIIIDPFREEQLQPNGYDIRIGPTHYVLEDGLDAFFPFIEELVNKSYVRKEAYEEVIQIGGRSIRGKFVRLPPHGFVIAATMERVGTSVDIAASLRCRSSLARAGISIARCAGWGDIGFDGVWTMEIVNHLSVPYYLPVGLRVGQIVFFRAESPAKRAYAGKYMGSREPAPPKLYEDEDLEMLMEIK
jgi:dCTP deaminase